MSLPVHNSVLVVDRFLVYRPQVRLHECFAEAVFRADLGCLSHDFLPTIALQYGDVAGSFEFTDGIGQLHPLTEHTDQVAVNFVDLAAEFEMRLRKAGGEGYVRMRAFNQELFQGLAVSGDHGCTPGFFDGAVTGSGMSKASPHGASEKTINRGEAILIDYTGVFDGYILDMTRMFVIGNLAPDLQQAFDTALAIQAAIAEAMQPGAICAEIFGLAEQMATNAGLGSCFMGAPGEQAKFVGHGVGLELDEMPVLAKGFNVPLQLNQTIAVEPKFVFPGSGVVGIENTFVVSKDGGERLTTLNDALIVL